MVPDYTPAFALAASGWLLLALVAHYRWKHAR